MRAAIVTDGVVTNIILADNPEDFDGIAVPDEVSIGWAYDGQAFIAPAAPEPDIVDPLTLSLTRRQVNAALIVGGGLADPDAAVEAAIGQIADATQRALALNDWRHAPHYVREHQLFNDPDLLAAMTMTPEQVDQLWALGSTLPA